MIPMALFRARKLERNLIESNKTKEESYYLIIELYTRVFQVNLQTQLYAK